MLKIKDLREAINMTQDQMVEITGIPKRSYVNYENGITDIPLSKLQNIASALNVTIGDLIDKEDKKIKSEVEISTSDIVQVTKPNVKENTNISDVSKNVSANVRKPNVKKDTNILEISTSDIVQVAKPNVKEKVIKKNDNLNDNLNDNKPNVKENVIISNSNINGNKPNVKENVTILKNKPFQRKTQYTHEQLQAIADGKMSVPKGKGVLNQPLQALAVENFEGLGNLNPIALVNEVAAAGYFGGGYAIEKEDIMRYYIVPDFKQVDFMIRIVGSSMYPKYNPGDIIAVRILYERTFIQWNKTHLFATREQGLIVKRPKKHPDPEYVTLVSDNKEYEPFDVPWEDIFGMAIIVGTIRVES